MIRGAIANSLSQNWIESYEETSGCDSWDDPYVGVGIYSTVQMQDVSARMQKDSWVARPQQENIA